MEQLMTAYIRYLIVFAGMLCWAPSDAFAARGFSGSSCRQTSDWSVYGGFDTDGFYTEIVNSWFGISNYTNNATTVVSCPVFFNPTSAAKTLWVDYLTEITCFLQQQTYEGNIVWTQALSGQRPNNSRAGVLVFNPPAAFDGYGKLTCIMPGSLQAANRNISVLTGYNTNWDF
jgi:hypothetical protein